MWLRRTKSVLTIALLLCAAVALAFPTNGIIDTFTGADETTPPTGWVNSVTYGASCPAGLKIMGNGLTTTLVATAGCAYKNTVYGPDAEAYWTFLNTAADGIYGDLCVRINTPGSNTTSGYCVYIEDGTDKIQLYRLNGNGTESNIDTSNVFQDIAIGDSVGISAIGTQICSWYKAAAGSWATIQCVTDATYGSAGYIMADLAGDTATPTVDDLGGGTIGGGGGGGGGPRGLKLRGAP